MIKFYLWQLGPSLLCHWWLLPAHSTMELILERCTGFASSPFPCCLSVWCCFWASCRSYWIAKVVPLANEYFPYGCLCSNEYPDLIFILFCFHQHTSYLVFHLCFRFDVFRFRGQTNLEIFRRCLLPLLLRVRLCCFCPLVQRSYHPINLFWPERKSLSYWIRRYQILSTKRLNGYFWSIEPALIIFLVTFQTLLEKMLVIYLLVCTLELATFTFSFCKGPHNSFDFQNRWSHLGRDACLFFVLFMSSLKHFSYFNLFLVFEASQHYSFVETCLSWYSFRKATTFDYRFGD